MKKVYVTVIYPVSFQLDCDKDWDNLSESEKREKILDKADLYLYFSQGCCISPLIQDCSDETLID